MRLLVTGSKSGIGAYLHNRFGGQTFNRGDSIECLRSGRFDVIIHCAFSALRDIGCERIQPYFEDNALLTERLTELAPAKFIFFSTVDLYAPGDGPHNEQEPLLADAMSGPYRLCKFLSEAYVSACSNYLILRPAMLMGRSARRNTLTRILTEDGCSVGLTADSRYNIVSHKSVGDLIEKCIKDDITGCLNVSATGDATLEEIARRRGHKVNFGDYRYIVSSVDNSRLINLLPAFRMSTIEVLEELVRSKDIPGL